MKGKASKVLVILGGIFLIAGVCWMAFGASMLVDSLSKLPTDFDLTGDCEGNFTTYVNPLTGDMLETPITMDFTGGKNYKAVTEECDSDTAVVLEHIYYTAGGQSMDQYNQYVVDRKSFENLKDDRAWDFDPALVVDRSGTLLLPKPDTKQDSVYSLWSYASGDFQIENDTTNPEKEIEGVKLYNFVTKEENEPALETFVQNLESQGMPMEIGAAELQAMLAEKGVDLGALTAVLAPILSPEDAAAMQAAMGQPIPLVYKVSCERGAWIEPTTGLVVDTYRSLDKVMCEPDLTALQGITTMVQKYASNPQVAALLTEMAPKMAELAGGLQFTVSEVDMFSTQESISKNMDDLKKGLKMLKMMKLYLPLGVIFMLALPMIGLGLLLARRAKKNAPAGS